MTINLEKDKNVTKVALKENERLDELQRNGYQIIQNPAELTHKEYTTLLEGLRSDGDSSELVSELESTKTDLATANGRITELDSELQSTKTELQNTEAQLADANAETTRLGSELQTAEADLADKDGQITQLQADIESLQDELAAALAALEEGSDEGIETQSLGYTKEELEDKTVAELQQLAEDENIELTATLKADIIQEILDAQ